MENPSIALDRAWPPTRAEALRRMNAFIPRAGRTYAAQRNYDRGPDDRANVSALSPYIRHRVLTEEEVLTATLERHSLAGAEKFVQEVFWRTYWKGWLEAHPEAWSRYRATLADRLAALDESPEQQRAYDAAVGGRTGIDAFDAWTRELTETNYLHNHARMWFASIWIFTLGLPWELGADFFMRHLLDGDPASNTLSWRWVAGLQTRGRTYTATRDNIRRYTGDRFTLSVPLARSTVALDDPSIPQVPLPELILAAGLKRNSDVAPTGRSGSDVSSASRSLFDAEFRSRSTGGAELLPSGVGALLVIHEDDAYGDIGPLPENVRAVCALRASHGRSPGPVSPVVMSFSDAILQESVSRLSAATGAADHGLIDPTAAAEIAVALDMAAAACGAQRVVVPFAPVGPVRSLLDELAPLLTSRGLAHQEFGRRYDAVSWPAATRGFFNLRSRIPAIVTDLGLNAG